MLGLAKRVGARFGYLPLDSVSLISFSFSIPFLFILLSLFRSVSYEYVAFICVWSIRILLTSTSEVYGDPLVHPQTEDYWGNVNPIGKL